MKIIVADDHPLARAGLARLLAGLAADAEVLEAADFPSVKETLAAHPDADLALVDLAMPGMTGAASIESLAKCSPSVPLVVVSASDNPRDMREALAAGAAGYVPKNADPRHLLGALRLVLSGGTYIPPQLAHAPPQALVPPPALTPRQREVLAALIEGRSNKEIARELALTEQTVKGHLLAIFKALNVRNRVQAVRAAQQLGLVRRAP